MRNSAFSLIELMVVIAIVALLAAIAVPNYRTYYLKSENHKSKNLLEELITKSTLGYHENGVFSDVEDIGLPSEIGGANATIPLPLANDPSGNVSLLRMQDMGVGASPPACPAGQFEIRTINPSCSYRVWIYDLNGIITRSCTTRDDDGITDCSVFYPECAVEDSVGTEQLAIEAIFYNSCPQ